MGFVNQRARTKFKVTPAQFDDLKVQFLADMRTVASMEGIPAADYELGSDSRQVRSSLMLHP